MSGAHPSRNANQTFRPAAARALSSDNHSGLGRASSASRSHRASGLRLSDSAKLPSTQQRDSSRMMPNPVSLNGRRVAQAFVCCLAIAVLALAHIQLRFVINDTRLQHQRMQNVHRALIQEHLTLERKSAMLTDTSRLQDFARSQLRMVETLDRSTAYVPASVRDKYDPIQIAKAWESRRNEGRTA